MQVVAVGGPGAGAAGEGRGGDAVFGEDLAGVLGAGAGGAHDQDVAAFGYPPDVGQGPLDVVQGDVEGAGQVASSVLTGRAHVDDGQFVQAGARFSRGEGRGCAHGRCHPWVSTMPPTGGYITPGGIS